ncbi:MAG: hypothetical protein RJA44_1424 [Pseudomonadota bacterium]|jgi:phosphinothricin acetyltransferase
MSSLQIRPGSSADIEAIHAIYAWNVQHGTGTFELEPPTPAEMAQRHADVLAKGLPWLVAEQDGVVLGYACASPFRPRLAFRFGLEDSIYLAPGAHGRGIGRLLLAELIGRCQAIGARQLFAVIGDSDNAGSIGVHRACGFTDVGVMRAAGWKFDRWLDVVLMQRTLGPGDSTQPQEYAPAPQGDTA